ncbi:ADP-ribosylglycohydrolase family protein [Streptomyces avermitilis]|uniref:ADP-ribosylglycohydrolase family protein n=1 Tax=Streptomyces avermitilis TaxID=33903 RepID=UPI0033B51CEA
MPHAQQPRLNTWATDRAAGVLLGAAVGDALGVPYEFEARLRDDQQPRMIGGGLGPYEPGEYSDDTQMQVCIAKVAADGADLRTAEALDAIAANFQGWLSGGASDVGAQTRAVLGAASRASGAPGVAMLAAARRFTASTNRSAGNGSLMRTGIVALSHLGDAAEMAEAAVAVSALTHPDTDCADACVLWCSGIRTAVLHGTFDGVRAGLDLIPAERRGVWAKRLDEAEANPPHHFTNNGWVVHALQAAWSATIRTAVPELSPAENRFPAQHFGLALEAAVRAGTDTDTVAAIAGALLGARWGCSGIPLEWQQAVHGWPGHTTGADLVRLAVRTARGGSDDAQGWPSAPRMSLGGHRSFAIPHPHDAGVGAPGRSTSRPWSRCAAWARTRSCPAPTSSTSACGWWTVRGRTPTSTTFWTRPPARYCGCVRRASGSCSTALPGRVALPPSPRSTATWPPAPTPRPRWTTCAGY